MTAAELKTRIAGVGDIPLHRFWQVEVKDASLEGAEIRIPMAREIQNNAGHVHGGVLYTALDIACYVACLPHLPPGGNVATVDISAQILASVPDADAIVVRGQVLKTGKRLTFAEARAYAGDTLIATGHVTKATIPAPVPR